MDEDKNYLEDAEGSMASNFQKTFGWYVVLNRITSNDITKHQSVLEKKMIEIFNQLTYIIQHDRLQAELQKRALK